MEQIEKVFGISIAIISSFAIIITNNFNYRFGFLTLIVGCCGLLIYFKKVKGGRKKKKELWD